MNLDKALGDAFNSAKRLPVQQPMPTQHQPQAPPKFLERASGFLVWALSEFLNLAVTCRSEWSKGRGASQDWAPPRGTTSLAGARSLDKKLTSLSWLPHMQNGHTTPIFESPQENKIPAQDHDWFEIWAILSLIKVLCVQRCSRHHLTQHQAHPMEVAYEHCWAQRTTTVAGLLSPHPAITSLKPPNWERDKGQPFPSTSDPFGGERTLGHFHFLRFLVL